MLKAYFLTVTVFMLLVPSIELSASTPEKNAATFVRLFPVQSLSDLSLQLEDAELITDNEEALKNLCLTDVPGSRGLSSVIISAIVGSGLKLIVNAIDKRIKRELEEYSASYEGSYGGRAGVQGVPAVAETKRYTCWRIVRGRYSLSDNTEELDFDAMFALEDVGDATKIYPLRLIMRRPAATKKSVNDKYGVAISLNIVPIIAGKPLTIFDGVILTDSLTLEKQSPVRYYLDARDECEDEVHEKLPLLCGKRSESFIAGSFPSDAWIQINAKVVEVGAAPRFLRFFSRTFSGAADDIGQALADAAAAKIDPPPAADK
jgi:hypothetical protein